MRGGQDVQTDPRLRLVGEWLLTNGVGGSACGTWRGAHPRRAHGYLHAATAHGRVTTVLLRLEERLHVESGAFDLAPHDSADDAPRAPTPSPIEDIRLDPWPTWRFAAGGVRIEKSLVLVPGHHAVIVVYRHLEGPGGRLAVSPLLVSRPPSGIQRERADLVGSVQGQPGRVRIEMGGERPPLTLWHNGAFLPARVWQRGLRYPADGPEVEDALVPGYIEVALAPGEALHVVASAEDNLFRALAAEGRLGSPPPKTLAGCVAVLEQAERERQASARRARREAAQFTIRQATAAHRASGTPAPPAAWPLSDGDAAWIEGLAASLEGALMRRGHRLTLAASFPEAIEHPTATLRALPGLVSLRAFEAARAVLRGYAGYLDEGLAPSAFDPDDGTPRYGDPEPALWMVLAADLLARRSEDHEFLRDGVYAALESVMQHYRAGTRGGVRVDRDGLLAVGEGAQAVKPVALNALWHHALVAIAQLARGSGRKESAAFYLAWAREHHQCFNEAFWDEANGCLYARLGIHGPEPELAPGQLLAASLRPSLLPPERAARLVETVTRRGFTPRGPTSGPDGAPQPEWLGAFYTAYLRAHGRSPAAQAQVRGWLEETRGLLDDVSFGLPPDTAPRAAVLDRALGPPWGLVAVAELLRVWIEEVDHEESRLAVV